MLRGLSLIIRLATWGIIFIFRLLVVMRLGSIIIVMQTVHGPHSSKKLVGPHSFLCRAVAHGRTLVYSSEKTKSSMSKINKVTSINNFKQEIESKDKNKRRVSTDGQKQVREGNSLLCLNCPQFEFHVNLDTESTFALNTQK